MKTLILFSLLLVSCTNSVSYEQEKVCEKEYETKDLRTGKIEMVCIKYRNQTIKQ